MKKELIVSISILVMVVNLMLVSVSAEGLVTKEKASAFLKEQHLLQGDDSGDLMLDKELTREQMAVILSRLLSQEDKAKAFSVDNLTFKDVSKSSWAGPYIAWAKANGIIQGYDSEKFGFGDSLTAWQAIALFVRALGYKDIPDEVIVSKAADLHITAGSIYEGPQADQKKPILRGDMSVLMYNTLFATNSEGKMLSEGIQIGSSSEKGYNTVSNIINSEPYVRQGDWIYYSNYYDGGKIYKIKSDGTGLSKLNDDPSGNLKIENDWLYYTNWMDNQLYKIKTDGTGRAKVK